MMAPMEQAMTWERMSGERLSDAERQRITDGGEFVRPTSRTTDYNQGLNQFVTSHHWTLLARWTAPAYVPPTSKWGRLKKAVAKRLRDISYRIDG